VRYGEERETQPALKVRVCGGGMVVEPISPQKGGVWWISFIDFTKGLPYPLEKSTSGKIWKKLGQ